MGYREYKTHYQLTIFTLLHFLKEKRHILFVISSVVKSVNTGLPSGV